MEIRTDGKFEYREDKIEWAADFFDCNKTEAVLRSIEFVRETHQDARSGTEVSETKPITIDEDG